MQIIHFLYGVANSDGKIANQEIDKINQIAIALGINLLDVESIKAMFIKSSDNAYKILEIESNASDEQVKTALEIWQKNIIQTEYIVKTLQ